MKSSEDIRPVTYLKSRAADLLAQVNETRRPVYITQNGEARGVLQDPESYEKMRAALALMKVMAQGEDDVLKKRLSSQDEVFDRLEKKLSDSGR